MAEAEFSRLRAQIAEKSERVAALEARLGAAAAGAGGAAAGADGAEEAAAGGRDESGMTPEEAREATPSPPDTLSFPCIVRAFGLSLTPRAHAAPVPRFAAAHREP